MRHIAIVGAGELGGAVAHALARRDVARAITLVDERGRVAEGKALDISQAAPVEGFSTTLSGAADLSFASGADLVVIADRFGAGEWQSEDALVVLRRVSQMTSRSIVVCAGASSASMIDRGVRELKMPRERLFGSAPEALAGAVKALVALAVNGSPCDIALTIVGLPPSQPVIAWEEATFAGLSLTTVIDDPTRRALAARAGLLWPPGPLALAAAATNAIAAIAGRSRQLTTCFVGPDLSSGDRTRTTALPVRLGPAGIVDVVMPRLSVVERVALEKAMLI